jgi:hypothetical protein
MSGIAVRIHTESDPPSETSAAPVIQVSSDPAMATTNAAISAGRAIRFRPGAFEKAGICQRPSGARV